MKDKKNAKQVKRVERKQIKKVCKIMSSSPTKLQPYASPFAIGYRMLRSR